MPNNKTQNTIDPLLKPDWVKQKTREIYYKKQILLEKIFYTIFSVFSFLLIAALFTIQLTVEGKIFNLKPILQTFGAWVVVSILFYFFHGLIGFRD